MTNALTTTGKAEIRAGGAVAALVPHTLDEAYRLSQALSLSGLVPRGFEKPEQVMVAIMAGAELGLAPYQALQSFAVVNGRATMWGDSLVAVVRAQGCRIRQWFDNESPDFPANMTAVCEVTRPDGEVIKAEFSVADAKLAGLWQKKGRNGEPTPWCTYPKRMLKNRARAFALRDGCADMLRGVQVREEVEDFGDAPIRDVTPRQTGLMQRLPGADSAAGVSATAVEEGIATQQPVEPEIIDAVIEEAEPPEAPQTADDPAPPQDTASEPVPTDGPAERDSDDDFPGDRPSSSASAPASANNGAGEGGFSFASDDFNAAEWEAWAIEKVDMIDTVADLDAFLAQDDVKDGFRRLQREDPTAAKRLDAKETGKRKALVAKERG